MALKLVPELKSKSEEVRGRAAKRLFELVTSELREVSPEELGAVLDLITRQMLAVDNTAASSGPGASGSSGKGGSGSSSSAEAAARSGL